MSKGRGPKTEKSSHTQSGDIPSKNPAIWLVENNFYQDLRRKISQDMGLHRKILKTFFQEYIPLAKTDDKIFKKLKTPFSKPF